MSLSNLSIANLNLADINAVLAYLQDVSISDWKNNLGTSRINGIYSLTAVLSPALVAANTTAEQAFTVSGLQSGDVAYVNKPTSQAGLGIAGARVTTDGKLGITFINATAAGITPTASETYRIGVIRIV